MYPVNQAAGLPPSAPAPVRRELHPGVLLGVSAWRALVVTFALIGFCSVVNGGGFASGNFAYLTQQSNFLVVLSFTFLLVYPLFTGGRRHEPVRPWLRGALTVLMSLVSVTYMTLLGGSLSDRADLFEHLLTPLVVVLDWLLIGRSQAAARWWFPCTWLVFPLAYLTFYIANGQALYPFLDPQASDFGGVIVGFLAGLLAYGFVIYGIGKLKGAISDSVRAGSVRSG